MIVVDLLLLAIIVIQGVRLADRRLRRRPDVVTAGLYRRLTPEPMRVRPVLFDQDGPEAA